MKIRCAQKGADKSWHEYLEAFKEDFYLDEKVQVEKMSLAESGEAQMSHLSLEFIFKIFIFLIL